MKQKKQQRVDMFTRVAGVMEQSKSAWQKLPELNKAFEKLRENNLEIAGLSAQVEKDLEPAVIKTQRKRKNLLKQAIPLASILQVLAWDLHDGKMAGRIDFQKRKMRKASDKKLIIRSYAVLEEAKRIYEMSEAVTAEQGLNEAASTVENIKGYGLNREIINTFEKSIKEFEGLFIETQDALHFQKKCNRRIKKLTRDTGRLMKNKIDLLLTLFENTDPAFFREYMTERGIPLPVSAIPEEEDKAPVPTKRTRKPRKATVALPQEKPAVPAGRGRKPRKTAASSAGDATKTPPARRGRKPRKAIAVPAGDDTRATLARRGRKPRKAAATPEKEKPAVQAKMGRKPRKAIAVPAGDNTRATPARRGRKPRKAAATPEKEKPAVQAKRGRKTRKATTSSAGEDTKVAAAPRMRKPAPKTLKGRKPASRRKKPVTAKAKNQPAARIKTARGKPVNKANETQEIKGPSPEAGSPDNQPETPEKE